MRRRNQRGSKRTRWWKRKRQRIWMRRVKREETEEMQVTVETKETYKTEETEETERLGTAETE